MIRSEHYSINILIEWPAALESQKNIEPTEHQDQAQNQF